MKCSITHVIPILTILAFTAHAQFAQFVHVAPGIENDTPTMRYSISTTPVLTIAPSDNNTCIVTIPLEGTDQHQQYWVIRCKTPIRKEQMNFREYVREYEVLKGWLGRIENDERLSKETKAKLMRKHGALKSRSDVDAIDRLVFSNEHTNIVLRIPTSEIERTYLYRDYAGMVMDGGYYYCFDIPAYYIKNKPNQGSDRTGAPLRGSPSGQP